MVYTIFSKSRPITIFLIGLLAGIVILWSLWDLNSKIIQELLILIFALILISYPIRNGIELDLSNRKYRRFYSLDRKSTRLNSSHVRISYAVFCLKKKNK